MSRPVQGNAASAAQVANAGRLEQDAAKQWAADVLSLAESPVGQRVLRRVIGRCGWTETGLGSSDAHTNFKAGRREIALWLVAEVTAHAPDMLGPILLPSLLP